MPLHCLRCCRFTPYFADDGPRCHNNCSRCHSSSTSEAETTAAAAAATAAEITEDILLLFPGTLLRADYGCLYRVAPRTPYHAIPYHTKPYHTIPYHVIPYHTIPDHIISYHNTIIFRSTKPYHTIPCHAMPYPTIPNAENKLKHKRKQTHERYITLTHTPPPPLLPPFLRW